MSVRLNPRGHFTPPISATSSVGVVHERVVPVLGWAVVDEDVHTAVDPDLERRREVDRTPNAGPTFAPHEHPLSHFHQISLASQPCMVLSDHCLLFSRRYDVTCQRMMSDPTKVSTGLLAVLGRRDAFCVLQPARRVGWWSASCCWGRGPRTLIRRGADLALLWWPVIAGCSSIAAEE